MNNTIIGGVAYIGGVSIIRALVDKKPITPVIAGTFLFMAFMGGLDLAGGPVDDLADAVVILAVIVVTIDVLPWQVVPNILKFRIGG